MKIKKGFLKRKIGGKYLVVATQRQEAGSMFIELNETSSDIWDGVAKGLDESAIANALVKKYGITQEKAEADVNSVLTQMREAGVMED